MVIRRSENTHKQAGRAPYKQASVPPRNGPRMTLPSTQAPVTVQLASSLCSSAVHVGARAGERKQTLRACGKPSTRLASAIAGLQGQKEGKDDREKEGRRRRDRFNGVRATAEQHDWSWTWVSGLVPDRRQKG
jgi:hypothetical protein